MTRCRSRTLTCGSFVTGRSGCVNLNLVWIVIWMFTPCEAQNYDSAGDIEDIAYPRGVEGSWVFRLARQRVGDPGHPEREKGLLGSGWRACRRAKVLVRGLSKRNDGRGGLCGSDIEDLLQLYSLTSAIKLNGHIPHSNFTSLTMKRRELLVFLSTRRNHENM